MCRATLSESDSSSLNSADLDVAVYVDSDTGMESMSSAETSLKNGPNGAQHCRVCGCGCSAPGCNAQAADNGAHSANNCCSDKSAAEASQEVVTKLKCDKLDLLRQNVVSVLFTVCNLSKLLWVCREYLRNFVTFFPGSRIHSKSMHGYP